MEQIRESSTLYPNLYSPMRIGDLTLHNRYVVPAVTTNFAEANGYVGDRLIAYLKERAQGGYGLIFTENIGVHPSGRVMPRMIMASDDSYVAGLRRLAESVKQEGSVLFGQINHAGRQTRSKMTGLPLVAASAIACPINREVPQALEIEEIVQLENAFVDAASRLAEAGFDGVEIHAAHGYLVAGFLSAYSNQRTDQYGGSFDNRLRFLLNIVHGIRSRLGETFPISVRISGHEFVDSGLDIDQSTRIAKTLQKAGIDLLSVSVGVYESFNRLSMITGEPEGQWLQMAAEIREHCRPLPVVGVGRIKRPAIAEKAIAAGQIDLAAFGRASLADSALPVKVSRGQESTIDLCLGCNVCLGRSSRPESICPVNPTVGREFQCDWTRTSNPARFHFLGTSLASLTAAWALARRGHLVSIDQDNALPGGMQSWRAMVPGLHEYQETIDAAMRRAVSVGCSLSASSGLRGAVHIVSEIRFLPVETSAITLDVSALPVSEVFLSEPENVADKRAAVVGSDIMTVEAALCLANRGAQVVLFTAGNPIATDAHPGYRERCSRLLVDMQVITRDDPYPLSAHSLGNLDLVYLGAGVGFADSDDSCWTAPVSGSYAVIRDAYEPDRMTRWVYEAFELGMKA